MHPTPKFHPTTLTTVSPGPQVPAPRLKPAILLLNGNHYVSAVIWTLLNHFGFEIVSETSGPIGLELARSLFPDAVVLDVNLPGMNGLEICRRLKADPATDTLPVIFCTGQVYLADEAMELGAAAFLDEMSGVIQLPDCLRKILSARTAGSDAV